MSSQQYKKHHKKHHCCSPSCSSDDDFEPETYLSATKLAPPAPAADLLGVLCLANDCVEFDKSMESGGTIRGILPGKLFQVCATGRYQITADLYPVSIPSGATISLVNSALVGYPDASIYTTSVQTGLHFSFVINMTKGMQVGVFSNMLLNSSRRVASTPPYTIASIFVRKIDTCH